MEKREALAILDEMEAFRREHYFDKPATPDFYMRYMAAIVARAAGYASRSDWTDALRENQTTKYYTDLQNSDYWGTF